MTDPSTSAKRRTWVGAWVRSEAFWRDVASQAVGALIVLLAGAGVAAIVAWASAEEVRPYLTAYGVAALIVIGSCLPIVPWLWFLIWAVDRIPGEAEWIGTLAMTGFFILLFAGFAGVIILAVNLLALWFGFYPSPA